MNSDKNNVYPSQFKYEHNCNGYGYGIWYVPTLSRKNRKLENQWNVWSRHIKHITLLCCMENLQSAYTIWNKLSDYRDKHVIFDIHLKPHTFDDIQYSNDDPNDYSWGYYCSPNTDGMHIQAYTQSQLDLHELVGVVSHKPHITMQYAKHKDDLNMCADTDELCLSHDHHIQVTCTLHLVDIRHSNPEFWTIIE